MGEDPWVKKPSRRPTFTAEAGLTAMSTVGPMPGAPGSQTARGTIVPFYQILSPPSAFVLPLSPLGSLRRRASPPEVGRSVPSFRRFDVYFDLRSSRFGLPLPHGRGSDSNVWTFPFVASSFGCLRFRIPHPPFRILTSRFDLLGTLEVQG